MTAKPIAIGAKLVLVDLSTAVNKTVMMRMAVSTISARRPSPTVELAPKALAPPLIFTKAAWLRVP